jgi:hypothetical protein
MQAAWSLRAPEILATCGQRKTADIHHSRYGFAHDCLVLDCEDKALVRRFWKNDPEGADENANSEASTRVRCVVRLHDDAALADVVLHAPERLDSFACQKSISRP